MRIAYFFEMFYPQINGVITATVNLAKNMKKMGHKVLFIVPAKKEYKETHTEDGIEVFTIDSLPTYLYEGIRASLPKSKRILCKLKREKIDILHFTAPLTMALNAIYHAKTLNIPVVQTFHTLFAEPEYYKYFTKIEFPFAEKVSWAYFNYFNKQSDIITAPSMYVIDQLKKFCPLKENIYISNGIDLDNFKDHDSFEKLKSEYPEYNRKAFVFIGRLGKEKSIDILLKAASEAIKVDKEIKLFIIGDGPFYNTLLSLVNELGIKKNVFLLGKIENKKLIKKGFLHHARAFVTASKTENQPMTILEAISCGAPLILPPEKGIKELLENNGMFFAADDHKELAEKMVLLSRDDKLYSTYRAESIKFSNKFDGKAIAKQFEKVYRILLEKAKMDTNTK